MGLSLFLLYNLYINIITLCGFMIYFRVLCVQFYQFMYGGFRRQPFPASVIFISFCFELMISGPHPLPHHFPVFLLDPPVLLNQDSDVAANSSEELRPAFLRHSLKEPVAERMELLLKILVCDTVSGKIDIADRISQGLGAECIDDL